jgi:hypothetical protein
MDGDRRTQRLQLDHNVPNQKTVRWLVGWLVACRLVEWLVGLLACWLVRWLGAGAQKVQKGTELEPNIASVSY